jgi:hypothetical protein
LPILPILSGWVLQLSAVSFWGVSPSVRASATHREAVEEIAKRAHYPARINSLSAALEQKALVRGAAYFGHVWKKIDDLAQNWEGMYWWISEEGLSMEVLSAKQLQCKINLKQLTPFETLAGRLFREAMIHNRVSDQALLSIARQLDGAGLRLKPHLKPADWRRIAQHNQKYARKAIRTFEQAIQYHARAVRRCLSDAKRRYEKACEI